MVGDRVLRGLVQAASSLAAADSEEILAEDLVREATRLTGFTRATLLRPAGESVTVLASQDDGLSDAGQPTFSRSLVRLAARGRGAVLGQVDLSSAASVDALGIVSAVCVPIVVAGVPAMALYLDSRKGEARAVGGAELIASALAEIVGPSFARLRARVVESQLARVEDEVRLAWDIQQEMMPRSPGSAGPLRFAMCSLPGRGMSGDLFDVFEAPDGRAVVWLGDVAGKGPAAAMLMARVQAGLRTAIDCGVPIPQALSRIAADVARLTNGLRFVTLLLLEIAADGRSVRAFDAGHGYGAILSASGSRPFGGAAGDSGSPPLGTVDDDVYAPIELHLDPGDRLLLMSDGVVEQPDPEHNEFGLERAIAAARSTDPSVAVSEVRAAVEGHRRTREQFDDVTIAVIA
jgi:sigma-B regulation protein RsbU (phosphoserine phosphatase)